LFLYGEIIFDFIHPFAMSFPGTEAIFFATVALYGRSPKHLEKSQSPFFLGNLWLFSGS
jgi:hypothetical protein